MLIKKLFCKHRNLTFIGVLPDLKKDNVCAKRAKFRCNRCGKIIYKASIFSED